jgi:RimJ/RimL family protein N-acetyltransferase
VRSPGALDGHGVRLRPWRAADAAIVEAIRADPNVSRWSGLAAEDTAAWIARQCDRGDGVSLAVTEPPGETAVGKVAFGRYDRGAGRAELSYWLIGPARGRGLAVAACRTLCEWGFTSAGLAAIVLDIEVDNEASKRVARALGASPAPGPPRVEIDRGGIPRLLVAYVVRRE